ncbi:hypothetical protein J4E91_000045 [Alternaria rosae]|uniref:putative glucosyl/glucuronosyl transferase n=1 Tax=Alternaria rosae TaxID=1187941 RepID=UPI001E8ED379|nr:putative glucosyl/glucuronosyl transferase [Alternaria rosae]KAH6878387.1 putative glucosyl/glucuronosyl transferase [Alternaria rosae]KAI4955838.1 hypothetical protein J4E91_000045 [Alternaria rosae]
MTTQPYPEDETSISSTDAQHAMLQQAQAAASAVQTETAGSTRQEAPSQTTDLITSDATDEEVPPPPYGDIYGEIRNEKDGLGTSASVTEDGRVNIRINQLNRRLSQVFTPALREHIQSVQDDSPTPPAYIPPSLGGKEGVPPPPSLNVVIQVVGSRGDVQPFVALGKVLKETYGHRVRLATHPTFKAFVQENGLEFFSIGGDPSQLMAFMVKNPGLMPGFRSLASGDVGRRRRDVAEYIQGCWRSCYETGDGTTDDDSSDRSAKDSGAFPFVADCIIANPPSFAHIHCAEKLGIPLHIMFTMPYSPTQAFPHPLANIQSSNADTQLTNYISYAMIEALSWQGLGDIMNRFRAKCLGLEPVSMIWAPGMLQRLKVPHTYCWSPALIPKPKDWGSHISISGFYFLNLASNYTPTPELQKFLDDGPPPVYIGFGSIVLDDPNAMTEIIFEATTRIAGGRRVLLSKGWGGMGAEELRIPENVFMLGNVPHDWLFKHVECVVHHGGAGTTAAGIAAGRPTLIIPFFGDQPFWGAMIARAGAGPDPIPYRQLTADKLADAINFCLKPESLERAKDLASKIATERGSDTGAQSFHQYLDPDRLRCTLAPSRVAVWRIKRTQIRLSAFAACTLANANLLDFHDLKLFRPQEYETDEGPVDPISGFGMGILRTLGSMSMGIAEMPSETAKAVQAPFGPGRQQSDTSVRNAAKRSESSLVGESSASSSSQQHRQSGAIASKPLARSQTVPNLPTSPSQTYSLASSSNKDNDMLRPTGLRTSKGFGRIVKAGVQSPMELSVGITKGFHNAPRLWNDTTVRPQEKVTDLKSGMVAIGREFGFGWYDGVTGLFTQPWKGAQKEGTSGFFKGVGKGIGGFIAKPGAALFGIPSYMMKGVHKEVQKRFGNSVQTYIVTSRTAQGYQEWLQSDEKEREDVIERWRLIQKYLKKKDGLDEMMKDVLDAQRRGKADDTEAYRDDGATAGPVRSVDESTQDLGTAALTSQYDSHAADTGPEAPLEATDTNGSIHQAHQNTPCADAEAGSSAELLQAMSSSEAEAQRHSREALEYEEQLKQAIAQSLKEQRQVSEDDRWEDLDSETAGTSEQMAAGRSNGPAGARRPPSYDPGHLAGTTQGEFQAQERREKTIEEKTEEEIVMEYVKKQSLLEAHHQSKGKGRASTTEGEDEEELQKALNLSMQEHE